MLAHRPTEQRLAGVAVLLLSAIAIQRLGPSVKMLYARGTDNVAITSSVGTGPSANISVDVTTPSTDTAPSPYEVCGVNNFDPNTPPTWASWTSLSGQRLVANSDTTGIPVYCARINNGAAAMITNSGTTKANVKASFRVSRGVYTIERLVFNAKSAEVAPRLDRLESVIAGRTITIVKIGELDTDHGVIYRLTNRSQQTAVAFKEAKDHVRALMNSHAAEYRKLMTPLRECESHVGALSGGIQPANREEALKHIHRAILTASHALAICQNVRDQHKLGAGEAESLYVALDELEQNLTELSAGCLNLVPAIGILTDPTQPNVRNVTISVTNAGGATLKYVRIGTDCPASATVKPAEEAVFSSLGPGQTVSATFYVRLTNDSDSAKIRADIAYLVARSPARLKLHAL